MRHDDRAFLSIDIIRVASVALGAREVEDDLLGLVFCFLIHGAVGMEELVGEVAKHGGAAGRDAALGAWTTGEEFLHVLAGRELVEFGQAVGVRSSVSLEEDGRTGANFSRKWRRQKPD